MNSLRFAESETIGSGLEYAFAFFDLPIEIQHLILRKLRACETRRVKLVSKEMKRLVERVTRGDFFSLPEKTQMKIITQTQMNPSEMRDLRLVSSEMKQVVENQGRRLLQQKMFGCIMEETTPGSFKFMHVNFNEVNMTVEEFSQRYALCHFNCLIIKQGVITLSLCDQLEKLREANITFRSFLAANTLEGISLMIVDRILSITGAKRLCLEREEDHFDKEFLLHPSIRKLERLEISGDCDFSDEELANRSRRALVLQRCCVSESGLRAVLEEISNSTRHVDCYYFDLRETIDVDRLVQDLPNLVKNEGDSWNLTTTAGQTMFFVITPTMFCLMPE